MTIPSYPLPNSVITNEISQIYNKQNNPLVLQNVRLLEVAVLHADDGDNHHDHPQHDGEGNHPSVLGAGHRMLQIGVKHPLDGMYALLHAFKDG